MGEIKCENVVCGVEVVVDKQKGSGALHSRQSRGNCESME